MENSVSIQTIITLLQRHLKNNCSEDEILYFIFQMQEYINDMCGVRTEFNIVDSGPEKELEQKRSTIREKIKEGRIKLV